MSIIFFSQENNFHTPLDRYLLNPFPQSPNSPILTLPFHYTQRRWETLSIRRYYDSNREEAEQHPYFRASAYKAEYKENLTGSADDIHAPEFQESDTDEISNRRRTPVAVKRTIKKVEIASRKCVPEIMIALGTVSALSCTIALIAVLLDHFQ